MTASKQDAKATRREKHLERQRALKERKNLRLKRAAIHAAMGQAAKMVRSKRKGCRDFNENMRTLGFEQLDPPAPGIGCDVLAKYEQIR